VEECSLRTKPRASHGQRLLAISARIARYVLAFYAVREARAIYSRSTHDRLMVGHLLLGIAGTMVLAWFTLLAALVIVRPRGGLLREALRLPPDVLRLVRRLAADNRTQLYLRDRRHLRLRDR
jgi:hypothetical protein